MNKKSQIPLSILFLLPVIISCALGADFALAQAIQTPQAAPEAPSFGELLQRMLPMFAIVFFIFYFMILKPQQKKLKDQQDLLTGLKKGDLVVTSGGIFAKVIGVEKDHALVEIAQNVKIKIDISHIARKVEKVAQEKLDKQEKTAA